MLRWEKERTKNPLHAPKSRIKQLCQVNLITTIKRENMFSEGIKRVCKEFREINFRKRQCPYKYRCVSVCVKYIYRQNKFLWVFTFLHYFYFRFSINYFISFVLTLNFGMSVWKDFLWHGVSNWIYYVHPVYAYCEYSRVHSCVGLLRVISYALGFWFVLIYVRDWLQMKA